MSRTGILKPLPSWRSKITESGLPPTARHVGLTLSLYANDRGDSIYPSLQTLAEDTGLHKETVHRYLGMLEQAGYIVISRANKGDDGRGKGGRNNVNQYRLVDPKERSARPTVASDDAETGGESDRSSVNTQVSDLNGQRERSTEPTDSERSARPTVPQTTVGLSPKQRSVSLETTVGSYPTGRRSTEDEVLDDVGAARPRDELFDAIVDGCRWSIEHLTPSGHGFASKARKELAGVGAHPSEIRAFCALWHAERAEYDLNPGVIVKHWAAFKSGHLFRRSVVVSGRAEVRDPDRERQELREAAELEREREQLQAIADRFGIAASAVTPEHRRRHLEALAADLDAKGHHGFAERAREEAAAIALEEVPA